MPSLWQRIVRSKKDHEARPTPGESPHPSKKIYQPDDETTSSDTRLHYINTGYGMHLLRHVHLVDPLQSPSWSGVQRTTPSTPSILHRLEATANLTPEAATLLQPGIINPTHNPAILAVRGLLLDTIKHVGPALDSPATSPYRPPKWLTKLAITTNSTTLRELPLNIAANPSRGSLRARNNPQAALQEKYDDFMHTVFVLALAAGDAEDDLKTNSKTAPKALFTNIHMCVTEAGYFGLVPQSARAGDNIFMVERDAMKSLFVVRRHPVHGFFLWNGIVYVHRLAEVVSNEHATDRIMLG